MKYFISFAAAMTLCLPAVCRAGNFQVQPGLWKIVVAFSMPAMPLHIPPQTVRKCITPAQAARGLQQMMHPQGSPGARQVCKLTAVTTHGQRVEFRGSCSMPQGNTGFNGYMNYDSPVHFHGQVSTSTDMAGHVLQMNEEMQGRRVAAVCPR
ncbi:MAG: DUF3617 domain-containing protein [Gammaproteobacteria bacterium]